MRRKPTVESLGPTQRIALLCLMDDAKSVRTLRTDHPMLYGHAAQGAITRLGTRGLIDVAGWERNGTGREVRTYTLTTVGRALADQLVADPDEEEC